MGGRPRHPCDRSIARPCSQKSAATRITDSASNHFRSGERSRSQETDLGKGPILVRGPQRHGHPAPFPAPRRRRVAGHQSGLGRRAASVGDARKAVAALLGRVFFCDQLSACQPLVSQEGLTVSPRPDPGSGPASRGSGHRPPAAPASRDGCAPHGRANRRTSVGARARS